MATQDQLKEDQDAFSAAFNEEDAPKQEMSEDEAFGLSEPKGEENATEDGADGQAAEPVDVAIVIDGGDLEKQAEDAQARQTAESAAEGQGEPAEVVSQEGEAGEVEAPAVDMEKEIQRLKSWEGRLKAMEAKLKGAGADTQEEQAEVVSEAIEQAADATDTPADEEKVEQIADQVESGELTPEAAMKQLAEDFGEDFVKMIEAIATAKAKEAGGAAASEKFGELSKTVDDIIGDIVDTKAQKHFEAIANAHPDFNEIGASEEFKTYVESLPEADKAAAIEVIGNGSAKQIIKLLDGFKAANAAGEEAGAEAAGELTEAKGESIVDEATDDAALDAAEGVRSSGMKLPDQPKAADDFAGAWNEF
jgi:hypothetical protein